MGPDENEQLDLGQLGPGVPYINIGTEKCCLFLHMSLFLCSRLKAYPLLYYAVEEGLKCAELGYYSSGILALSQLLNIMNERTPKARHRVAHKLLRHQPAKGDFDKIRQQVGEVAKSLQEKERKREPDAAAYCQKLLAEWTELITSLHPERLGELG